MSDSKRKTGLGDDDSWGSGAARVNPDEESKHSGIVFLHQSGAPAPEADSREEFVRFACEQVLRDYELGRGDLERGLIPDSKMKAFAAAYVFVRGVMVRSDEEAERLADTGEGAKLELILVQATREAEFTPDRLWAIRKTAQRLFSLGEDLEAATTGEPEILVQSFRWFRRLGRGLAEFGPEMVVRYVYVSRGDVARIGPELQNESDGIVAMTRRSLEGDRDVRFDFIAERNLIV